MLRNQSINVDTDPALIGLQLLSHIVADADLGTRFLALSGMAPEDLRTRAADREVLAALIEFVAAHEGDLVAAAEAIGATPEAIVAAGRALGGGPTEVWP